MARRDQLNESKVPILLETYVLTQWSPTKRKFNVNLQKISYYK